jgi:GH24 family phage-related lysozyme (muramidase)
MVIERRAVVSAIAAVGIGSYASAAWAAGSRGADFDAAILAASADVEAIEGAQADREGLATLFEFLELRGPAPRLKLSTRRVSARAIDLLVLFEVTNRKHYEKRLFSPVRPGGMSGVTIGIGYDLGYHREAWVREDWAGMLPERTLDRLCKACLLKGSMADPANAQLSDVVIGWEQAERQFLSTTLPRFIAETQKALPATNKLSDDSLGALVSLLFNRGPSFGIPGDRYAEMNAIREFMRSGNHKAIPGELRKMKRLWEGKPGLRGVVLRRELEAQLFELGLSKR